MDKSIDCIHVKCYILDHKSPSDHCGKGVYNFSYAKKFIDAFLHKVDKITEPNKGCYVDIQRRGNLDAIS